MTRDAVAPAPRFLLLSDRGCPFAHRVRALFTHLGVEHDLIETPPGTHPPELARWSASQRIPLLVSLQHGMGIGESRVMLDLVAETHAFTRAYPERVFDRALHREAMAIVDEKIAPTLLRGDQVLRPARLTEYLDRLTHVARSTPPAEPCLLAFHIAPIWLRLQWWRPQSQVTQTIRERTALVEWLDAIARLPAIAATSPARAESIEDFNAVCALSG